MKTYKYSEHTKDQDMSIYKFYEVKWTIILCFIVGGKPLDMKPIALAGHRYELACCCIMGKIIRSYFPAWLDFCRLSLIEKRGFCLVVCLPRRQYFNTKAKANYFFCSKRSVEISFWQHCSMITQPPLTYVTSLFLCNRSYFLEWPLSNKQWETRA